MRPNYGWISYFSMALYAGLYGVATIVCWMGWLRKRHIGYFVLAVWAFLMGLHVLMAPLIIRIAVPWLRKVFPGNNGNVAVGLVSIMSQAIPFAIMLLMLAGLA